MATNDSLMSDRTKNVIKGVAVGGLGTAAAVALAPIVLPAVGLGAAAAALGAGAAAVPWLGAAVGGYLGYNKSTPAEPSPK